MNSELDPGYKGKKSNIAIRHYWKVGMIRTFETCILLKIIFITYFIFGRTMWHSRS